MKKTGFRQQYEKDFNEFVEINQDMSRMEIILNLVIPVPLKKSLITACLMCFASFYILIIALWTIPFFTKIITNDILTTLGFCTIFLTVTGICFICCPPLLKFPFYVLKTRKNLLMNLFDDEYASQDLIDCMEKSCKKTNRTPIMYQLLNVHTSLWLKGTNGRLKGFYYKKTYSDYGFLEEIENIHENMRMQMEEIEGQKKAFEEKKKIEDDLSNISIPEKVASVKRL